MLYRVTGDHHPYFGKDVIVDVSREHIRPGTKATFSCDFTFINEKTFCSKGVHLTGEDIYVDMDDIVKWRPECEEEFDVL